MIKSVENIWIDLHQELKKFIVSKVKDQEMSNDILQDVFLKIHLNIHTLKDCSKLTSWIYQITRNVIADFFRNKREYEDIHNFDLPEEEQEPQYQALANCINSKIDNLPEKYKEAILFTTLKDFSQIELSHHLGISYSGTKSRVHRSKEKLKALVSACENVEKDEIGNIIDYEIKI